MAKAQFSTRQTVGFGSWQKELETSTSSAFSASDLHFCNGRGTRLLVSSKAGGAFARQRHSASHAAFSSVSTSSSSGASSFNDGLRKAVNDIDVNGCLRQQEQTPPTTPSLERLPVAVKKGDQLLPYVWDGRRISAMSEAALLDTDVNTGRLRNWLLGLQRQLKEAFLPDPRDVTPDYWEWLRWRLSQRFFSSTMQNFSFSALLMATGLGAKKAFAASAAINWLLKDGVSRIVRMTVSTSFGQTFDADLKRMRFITSLIFTACMAGEFATPFWPQHFVALASVSSVGRAIGLSAFVATQPAFQAALATGGNLADLTSKNQAQHMVMDMMALGVSAGLTWLCRGMPRGGLLLPAIMYPICAAGDLTCIWHELKAVQLRTLNRERAEMVIERWMRRGAVPSAAEISDAESLILPSDVWQGLLPLRITPLDRLAPHPDRLRQLLNEYDGEQYLLYVAGRTSAPAASSSGGSVEATPGRQGTSGGGGGGDGGQGRQAGSSQWPRWLPVLGARGGSQPEVLVSLSDRATPQDITKALLHAAYLRQLVLQFCLEHLAQPPKETADHPRPHHHHHKQLHHHHGHHHGHHSSHHQHHQHQLLEGPPAHLHSAAGFDGSSPGRPSSPGDQMRLLHAAQQSAVPGGSSGSNSGLDGFSSCSSSSNGSGSLAERLPAAHVSGVEGAGPDALSQPQLQPHDNLNHLQHHQHHLNHHQRGPDHHHRDHHHQHHHNDPRAATGGPSDDDMAPGLLGHSHPHLHWDATHRTLIHHTHYHTHKHTHGAAHSQGHTHGAAATPTRLSTLAPVPHTASLSLSQGQGHVQGSSGAGAVAGCVASTSGGSDGNGSSSCGGSSMWRSTHGSSCTGSQPGASRLGAAEGGGVASERQPQEGPATAHDGARAGGRAAQHREAERGHRAGAVVADSFSLADLPLGLLDEVTWEDLIRSSRREAERNLPQLLSQAEQAGWKLKPFMLNTTERVQFVRI